MDKRNQWIVGLKYAAVHTVSILFALCVPVVIVLGLVTSFFYILWKVGAEICKRSVDTLKSD